MNFEKIKTYFPVFRKAKSKNGEMTHTKIMLADKYLNCIKCFPVYASMPLSPRKPGTSLRVRGKLTLRKKEIVIFKMYYLIIGIKR